MQRPPVLSLSRLLAALVLFASIATAQQEPADAPAEAPDPNLSKQQVLELLSLQQRLLWEEAEAKRASGVDDIESGEWMLAREQSDLTGYTRDLRRVHEGGRRKIAEGEAKIAEAEKELAALRAVANQRYLALQKANEPIAYTARLASGQWKEHHKGMLGDLMNALWEEGYARLYFGGYHVLDRAGYYRPARLNEVATRLIRKTDSDLYTFVATEPGEIAVVRTGSTSQVTVPDRERVLRDFQAAILIGELVPFESGDKYLLSLRGVDLRTLEIVAAESLVVPASGALGDLIARSGPEEAGSAAEDVSADATESGEGTEVAGAEPRSEQPASEDDAPVPAGEAAADASGDATAPAVELQLVDLGRFIKRLEASETSYTFGLSFDSNGHPLSQRDRRRSILLAKLLLLEQGSPALTDTDFLATVLSGDGGGPVAPADADTPERPLFEENALWVVTHVRDDTGTRSLELKAMSLENREQLIEVGPLEIDGRARALSRP